jgi:hypothetical protein
MHAGDADAEARPGAFGFDVVLEAAERKGTA